MQAAIELFVKNGVHHTSMQALAKHAGVATGSVYTYFKNKEALICETFYDIAKESVAFSTQQYDFTASVKTRFYHLLRRRIQFDVAQPDKFRFISMCVYEPAIMSMIKDVDLCKNSPMAQVLTDGQAAHCIKNVPLDDLFYQVFGGVSSLLGWRLVSHTPVVEEDIEHMLDMAWDAIKQEGAFS